MSNPDVALGDPTTDAPTPGHEAPAGGVFGVPGGHDHDAHQPPATARQWSIDEILEEARLPEKYARVCLRADLDAREEQLLAQLGSLVDAQGELLEDAEASMGEETAASRAREIHDELRAVQAEKRAAMWFPLFRGMCPDDRDVFNEKYYPKKDGADLTGYHARLIAECTVDDDITYEKVLRLRRKLGGGAYGQLVQTAVWVCTRGGVDVGKSPAFSVTRPGQ